MNTDKCTVFHHTDYSCGKCSFYTLVSRQIQRISDYRFSGSSKFNCTNGAFATRLCDDDIDVVLYPPVFYDNVHITSEKGFYVVTIGYEGSQFDLIMAINENVELASQETYL